MAAYILIKENQVVWLGTNPQGGDWLSHVIIMPQSKKVGAVTISDGADSLVIYQGGVLTGDLVPFNIPLDIQSKSNGFKVSTGAGLQVLAIGDFK